jgi:hypothetical protein
MLPFFLKSRNLIIVLLTMVAAVFGGVIITAQQRHILSMEEVMTKSEFTESGVVSLSPAQRNALDSWLNRYTAHVVQVVAAREHSTATPKSDTSSGRCTPAIESAINGEFNGWDGETIFKLSNGQIWQQAEYDYMYSYSYSPDVTIYSTQSGCRMKVEDEDETIPVKRLK